MIKIQINDDEKLSMQRFIDNDVTRELSNLNFLMKLKASNFILTSIQVELLAVIWRHLYGVDFQYVEHIEKSDE